MLVQCPVLSAARRLLVLTLIAAVPCLVLTQMFWYQAECAVSEPGAARQRLGQAHAQDPGPGPAAMGLGDIVVLSAGTDVLVLTAAPVRAQKLAVVLILTLVRECKGMALVLSVGILVPGLSREDCRAGFRAAVPLQVLRAGGTELKLTEMPKSNTRNVPFCTVKYESTSTHYLESVPAEHE
eukprot:2219425-Rhodomonas_salina.2